MNLWAKIDKAERKDDVRLKCDGLVVGEVYHIRSMTNGRSHLTTGNYEIKDFAHGAVFRAGLFTATARVSLGGWYFKVEGSFEWLPFDETFVFSEVNDVGK